MNNALTLDVEEAHRLYSSPASELTTEDVARGRHVPLAIQQEHKDHGILWPGIVAAIGFAVGAVLLFHLDGHIPFMVKCTDQDGESWEFPLDVVLPPPPKKGTSLTKG